MVERQPSKLQACDTTDDKSITSGGDNTNISSTVSSSSADDPRLARLADVWPTLPEHVRQTIALIALGDAGAQTESNP